MTGYSDQYGATDRVGCRRFYSAGLFGDRWYSLNEHPSIMGRAGVTGCLPESAGQELSILLYSGGIFEMCLIFNHT